VGDRADGLYKEREPTMRSKVTGRSIVVSAAISVIVSGCSDAHGPVAPTPAPAPVATPAPAPPPTPNTWAVVIQVTSTSGPEFCIHLPTVGSTFSGDYQVGRRGDVVTFNGPDEIDWDSFVATLDGTSFTATNPPMSSGVGMCTHYLQSQTVAGSFSSDWNSFSATETWFFTLDSGDVRTVTFAWTGTHR
jgi:hypothetical protein